MNSILELKVYYEDTDAGGVVYYANYLRYFERARTEFLAQCGISVSELANKGIIFVVVKVQAEYLFPAQLGDVLQIETNLLEIKKVSMVFDYIIRRKIDDKLLVTGSTKIAVVSPERKVIKLPEEIFNKIVGNLS
ncbi:MAG: YbgC/FadM family acyl-CoA thioesterase [Endomicrobiia bacterium]